MKINEQRMRIKAVYKSMHGFPPDSNNKNSSSSSRADNLKFMKSYDGESSQRANTTAINDQSSIYKTMNNNNYNMSSNTLRNDLNSAATKLMLGGSYKNYNNNNNNNRDAMSTRGGISFASRMDFDQQQEAPFLILPDQESLSQFMTKQRKMVSSVSSKYMNYNNEGKSKHIGDGLSTINGDYRDNNSPNKIGNFNEYQHVFNDSQSNEANVNWITKLRGSESHSNLLQSTRLNTVNNNNGGGDNKNNTEKQHSVMYDSNPPSVYYKGNSDQFVKRVTDYQYKGNHLDVSHLTRHRLGPTPNIGQVVFETGLRKYQSEKEFKQIPTTSTAINTNRSKNLDQTGNNNLIKSSANNSQEREKKEFVTIFPKSKSILSTYAPSFLPPISTQARKQLDQLEVIVEQTKTVVKGLHKKPDSLQMISSFDGFHKSMPKFTDKVEDVLNYNQVRQLMKGNKKMSEVLWELSLRPDAYKKNELDDENRRKFTAATKNPQAAFDGLSSIITNEIGSFSNKKSQVQYFSQPRTRGNKNKKQIKIEEEE